MTVYDLVYPIGKDNMNERQAQKRIRTTETILIAAKELIHENGFNRLSLRAVAARAGFSPASLYEYFTGKDDIIDSLCAQIDQSWAQQLQSCDTIPSLMLGYVTFGLNAPDDFQLLYQRAMLPNQEEYLPNLFTDRITACQENLEVSVEIAQQTMWALAHGMVLLSLHRELNVDDHERMIQKTWNGLLKPEYRS